MNKQHDPTHIIFVLGMHRSGTSAMTGMLKLLGLELGDRLMKGGWDNEKGFFEDLEVVAINDALLEAFHLSWDSIIQLPADWVHDPRIFPLKNRIKDLLFQQKKANGLIAIKDPRMSFTLALWQEVIEELEIEHRYVIMLRHPQEIAASLAKRNHFSEAKCLINWAEALFSVEAQTRKYNRIWVSYDDLLSTPLEICEQIQAQLKLTFPVSTQQAKSEILDFLTPSLRHHRSPEHHSFNHQYPFLEKIRHTFSQFPIHESGSPEIQTLEGLKRAWHTQLSFFHPPELQEAVISNREKEERLKQLERINEHLLAAQAQQLEALREAQQQFYHEKEILLANQKQIQNQLDWQLQENAHYHLERSHLRVQNQALHDEVEALRTSVIFRLGRLVTSPAHWMLVGLQGVGKLLQIATRNPGQFLSLMRYKHVKTLFHALRTEEPTEILDNFNRLLTGESTKKEAVQSIEELEVVKAQFTAQKKDALAHFLQEGKSLICTRSDQPQVSIILILHNRAELTYSCLLSLLEVSISTEILIIDNASTDETQALLSLLTGCKIITNPENIGFLRACNQAAQLAKGEHLLFLNNDTQLLPGSLEAAVTTLTADPKIGAVGGSIRLLDGKLQEAGSIIWQDGSCLGYGRGQDPEAPEFKFKRSVDYVSGVFLLTPRELFEAMGGFDEAFLPAYYEETDYCMRLWQQGYQVIYNPEVKVIHYEFGSAIHAQDAIALQQAHQQIFVERHQEMLLQHLIPQAANIILARHAAQRAQKKILFIEDKIPHVDEGAGFPRSNQILNHLHHLGCQLSVLPFTIPHHCPWEQAYRDVDREIELVQGTGKDDFLAFLMARPHYYDIIWICRPHNLAYFTANMEEIRPLIGDAKIIYDSEAVFSNRDIAKAQLDQDTVQIKALANQLDAELAMGMHADAIIAVNEMEASQFREEVNQPVFVLDASFPIKPSSSQFEQRSGLLFVGNMDHDDSPNVDSIEWLLTEVYPHIAKRMETPRLTLIGSQRSAKIQALARQHACVRQIGQVEDLAPFFARSRVFVAPTRYGAGSPAKALQAAAYGLPMVCTDLIQRQLGWASGEVLLSAPYTTPKLFADHICRLYREEELHMRMSTAVVKQVRNAFSSEKQQEMIKEILAAM